MALSTIDSYRLEKVEHLERWNSLIAGLPQAHILQTQQWGQVKARLGWKLLPYIWNDSQDQVRAAALVLQRTAPNSGPAARFSVLYIPRGPLADWSDPLLRESIFNSLQTLARQKKAIFIKIDPEIQLGLGIPGAPDGIQDPCGESVAASLKKRGWCFSTEQVQFRNTVLVDLEASEDDLIGRMKQKTRYNIRLAGRKGVTVRKGTEADFPMLYKMYAETSLRDGFVIRDQAYYEFTWHTMLQAGMADILIADVAGEPVAAVVVFRFKSRAWYLYGMSRELHRDMMPNYLLQWEAMRQSKASGCQIYDLWGAPDRFEETDPMWGVFRFKEGLGGYVMRTPGAWDYPARPLLYRLYTQALPRFLEIMRRRGKARIRDMISG